LKKKSKNPIIQVKVRRSTQKLRTTEKGRWGEKGKKGKTGVSHALQTKKKRKSWRESLAEGLKEGGPAKNISGSGNTLSEL